MPKARSIDFPVLQERFRIVLMGRGVLSSGEACRLLGISQTSFSRLVEKMGKSLLMIGKARRRQYALKRKIEKVADPIPIYWISTKGSVGLWGRLHPIEPRGFFFEALQSGMSESIYTDLPYFLDDLRPTGFLGRFIPRNYPQLQAPNSILEWSSEDCLRYWTHYGSDLVGNWILGEFALQQFLAKQQAVRVSIETSHDYPRRAREVHLRGDVGFSAGGEQAKFLVDAHDGVSSCLVKFSPPVGDEISQRIADLLICEHLAHKVLSKHRIHAAQSRIVQEEHQIFLEVQRFDRVGNFGRRAVISLRALSLEFVGSLGSWSEISQGLLLEKLISATLNIEIQTMELFGKLIGNSDMHAGNLSFYLNEDLTIAEVAPIYDMLPMMYFPRQNQILDPEFLPRLPTPDHFKAWKSAANMASLFWEEVSQDTRISKKFREISVLNHKVLRTQFDLAVRMIDSNE